MRKKKIYSNCKQDESLVSFKNYITAEHGKQSRCTAGENLFSKVKYQKAKELIAAQAMAGVNA